MPFRKHIFPADGRDPYNLARVAVRYIEDAVVPQYPSRNVKTRDETAEAALFKQIDDPLVVRGDEKPAILIHRQSGRMRHLFRNEGPPALRVILTDPSRRPFGYIKRALAVVEHADRELQVSYEWFPYRYRSIRQGRDRR
ncbi:hypothetical protein SDC9_112583 [bioreactor metagenome]|uniref:Uncharacterized protein n=1 Tax=bioreactor metagenome TaxID=1076179 RepID=A0A645BKC3_9ZZZZ